VRTYVLAAHRLYEELEYESALEELGHARRLSLSTKDAVAISLYEGVILANLGKKEASIVAFKAALVLQPEAKLPMKVSPKVQQQFETVREEVKRERAKQDAERPVAEVTPAPPQPSVRKREQAKRRTAKREEVHQEAGLQGAEHLMTEVDPEPQLPPVEEKPTQDVPIRESVAQVEVVEMKSPDQIVQAEPVEAMSTQRPVPAEASAVPMAEVSGRSMRGRAWLPASVGGVLLVAGGASWLMARSEASKLDNNDARLATRAEVEASVSRGRTWQTVGMGLVGAGVLGLGLAGGMYLYGAPSEPETLGLGVSTDGTSAFVYGRLP
jgi:tetratricopeptide (TPR) repeat protein